MKIRLSIRLYLLGTLVFLITSLAALYFVVTVQYFIEGLDKANQHLMINVANEAVLGDDGQASLLGYHITKNYADVPPVVRQHFPAAPPTEFQFNKAHVQENLFSRPSEMHFLMLVRTPAGELRYVSRTMDKINTPPPRAHGGGRNLVKSALLLGLSVIVVFTLLLLLILRSISNPMEALRDWARGLQPENLRQPAPDFRYNELNTLAEIVRSSLLFVQQALDREHDFLRHASHELRTPIATVRSNVELLHKLNPDPPEKERKVIARIERASATMNHLTDTLLWLSREAESNLPTEPVELDQMLAQTCQDLRYLLQGKEVEVHIDTRPTVLPLPRIAVQIMLANLIRNAFQHTQAGEVWIEQEGARVAIVNRNHSAADDLQELGFGLGLDLTRKLAERFQWVYKNEVTAHGHEAEVRFAGEH
ncbi:MAG: HAMP domain-containing histidine kinase [Gammaproteobacteria bacterium]|uniref:sensor histidine kinase n=1 Tax=Pseudomaricurvus alcaniphilus TaxID=1166482 RepID=UPI00140D2375|nr:HAMP domain-containing sensor histidine kinase [Pseudomaricurvus alcaniphilus]MBR9910134.1 HAMP domain-containing histidine kinase [Gammaproteobacteria bacterium]NHN36651.1 HAMP domain-containing histidine kinase [Pseudomaricurvus alcaniphilus]